MAPSPLQILWMASLVPFWLFHITSTFFKLYILISIYDCVVEVNMFLGLRFHLFDFVKPLYLSFSVISSFLYINSAYILYVQCFSHLAIAINRLWAIWMAAKVNHQFQTLASIGVKLIFLIPFLPLPLLAPRMPKEAKYYVTASGELGVRYFDTYIQAYQSSVTVLVVIITAILSFICEMITVFKYHLILKKGNVMNSEMRQELRLLGQALIILVIQLLMGTSQFFVYLSSVLENPAIMQIALQHFIWIDDLLNLSGPIALFVVSKAARKDYIVFWSGGKLGGNMVLTSQQSFTNPPKKNFRIHPIVTTSSVSPFKVSSA